MKSRHFVQTGEVAGLPKSLVREAIEEMADTATAAIGRVEDELPMEFPETIHRSVKLALTKGWAA